MWSVIVFLLVGIAIGALFPFGKQSIKALGHSQTIGVIVLLFVMGLSIGMNKSLLVKLQSIGYKAAIFALLTTAFSILAVYLITQKIKPRRETP